jgi:CO/xanthine dehydrogenase Mo-binding subunit
MVTKRCRLAPYVGRPLRRREGSKFPTGRGRYVDDMKLPGTFTWQSCVRRTRMP